MADAIGGWWTMHGAAIRVSVTLQAKLMSMHCGRKLTSPTMSPLQAKSPKPSNLNIPPLKNTKHVHSTPAGAGCRRNQTTPDTIVDPCPK